MQRAKDKSWARFSFSVEHPGTQQRLAPNWNMGGLVLPLGVVFIKSKFFLKSSGKGRYVCRTRKSICLRSVPLTWLERKKTFRTVNLNMIQVNAWIWSVTRLLQWWINSHVVSLFYIHIYIWYFGTFLGYWRKIEEKCYVLHELPQLKQKFEINLPQRACLSACNGGIWIPLDDEYRCKSNSHLQRTTQSL